MSAELFHDILYKDSKYAKMHNNFWGDYAKFGNLDAPKEQTIRNYQLSKLEAFQKLAFSDNRSKAQAINNFLFGKNGQGLFNTSEDGKNVEKALNNIFENIKNIRESGGMSKTFRAMLGQNTEKEAEIKEKLQTIATELNNIVTLIKGPEGTISGIHIDTLFKNINNLSAKNLDILLRNLLKLQGEILEEVGTLWFNKIIPTGLNVKAFSVGTVKNKKGQQLGSDILYFDMDDIDLLQNLQITYRIDDKEITSSVKDFLNKLDESSTSTSIQILNNEVDLMQAALGAIQAKSGQKQLPWNVSTKNTWLSIGNAGGDDATNNYINFLYHMQNLRNSIDIKGNSIYSNIDPSKEIKMQSDSYQLMADYTIGHQLSILLHLSKEENNFLLTPKGFVPYTERIIELCRKMTGQDYPFKFRGRIRLNERNGDIFITKKRPVILFDR